MMQQAKPGANAVWNWIAGFALACGAVLLFVCVVLAWKWDAAAPLHTDVAHGLVMPHKARGTIVYLSAYQSTSLALMFWSAPLFLLAGIAAMPKRDRTTRSGALSFAVRWQSDDPGNWRRRGEMVGLVFALAFVLGIGPKLVMHLVQSGVIFAF